MFKFFVRFFNKPIYCEMFNKTIINYSPTIIVNSSERTDMVDLVRATIDAQNKIETQIEPLQDRETSLDKENESSN